MTKNALSVKIAALFLASAAAACFAASCSDAGGDAAAPQTEAVKEETAVTEEETQVTEMKDGLPDDLDFGGVTLTLPYEDNGLKAKQDLFGESSGDIVSDAVYKRTLSVEERLNIRFEWIKDDSDEKVMSKNLEKIITAGQDDYDMVIFQLRSAYPMILKGLFRDLAGSDYIDIERPWWYKDLMDQCTIDSSRMFFVMGDMTLTPLKGASSVFYSKPLFENYYGDSAVLYQTVLDGKWTHDVLAQYCRGAYSDLDGDGSANQNDQYGFVWPLWGVPNYLSMSNGLSYQKRGDDGLPVLDLNNDMSVLWMEKLSMLLYTDNMSYMVDYGTTPEWFKNGRVLFHIGTLMETDDFRDLGYEYGLLPHPKLTEELNYTGGARVTNGAVGVIPVSSKDDAVPVCAAAMEALASESCRSVVQVWYESALKVKYVSSNADAQMIDVIRSAINVPIIYATDKAYGLGSTFTYVLDSAKGNFASYWAKNEKSINSKWDDMIESYLSVGR